jgi:oxygen-independent coproporphyrinogen-3 oxidase
MNLPLALYIHFPWCVKKCPYCDFNSHQKDQNFDETCYIKRLIADFIHDYENYGFGRKIQTLFMGGGTPSLFSAQALESLLHALSPYLVTTPEITLEANPGTIEHDQFKDYFALGINRVSLGVQTFNERHLKNLGRIHSRDDAHRAVDELQNAGFSNFNLDLMHGLPMQTAEEALVDLTQALALCPTHLSWYQLTIEPNTYFAKFPPRLPDDAILAEIETQGFNILAQHGFERYEISAFARVQKYCQHNLNYWNFGDYIGIGAGAHGKITDFITQKIIRTSKHKLPKTYLDPDKNFLSELKEIPSSEQMLEFMMNALRLTHGFSMDLLHKRIFTKMQNFMPLIARAQQLNLLHQEADHLQPTAHGLRFLNDLLMIFNP